MGFQVNICGKKLDEKGVKALLAAMAARSVMVVVPVKAHRPPAAQP